MVEYLASCGALAVVAAVALGGAWPFELRERPDAGASIVTLLLHDRVILGLLRATVVVAALYAIASVPALVVSGRWAIRVGTSGIVADDARREFDSALAEARADIADLEAERARLLEEHLDLWRLIDVETTPD